MADLSGQQFGDYRLLRRLGSGTFGEVYEAEKVYLKTHAAIKVLHDQLDHREFQRFLEEARTIAALEHPHIVRVVNFSIQQHTPYLVMQLAHSSLRDRFAAGQSQSLATILPYLRQAAVGLQYAHDRHMMHLDIKPANLLLTAQNLVLLADFGLAMVLQTQRTHRTLYGFAGTPGYAAPEQFQNKPGWASDQYALGVMVYQWLVGRLPFEGDWWAIGHQKLTQDPPPLRAHAQSISSAVEDVVLRALAKDPKARFASVQDFATALTQAAQDDLDTESRAALASFPQGAAPEFTSGPPRPVEPADVSFASPPSPSPPTVATSDMPPVLAGEPDSSLPLGTDAARKGFPLPRVPQRGQATRKQSRAKQAARIFFHRGISRGRVTLLLVLVFILLLGGIGSFFYTTTTISTAHMQATATVKAGPTATSITAVNKYNRAVAAHGVMFGFDAAHSHFNPFEQILSPATVPQLKRVWTALTGYQIWSSPAVANGVVYIGSLDHKLYAFKAQGCGQPTCAPLWTASTKGNINSSPLDHRLYAYHLPGIGV